MGEKKAFVMCLYCKLVLERKKPEFVNVDEERLHELTQVGERGHGRNGPGEDEEVVSQQVEGYS